MNDLKMVAGLATVCALTVAIRNGSSLAPLIYFIRAMETRPAQYYLNAWHNR